MERTTLSSFFNELDSIHAPIEKEAGWGRDFQAWVLKRHRKAKQVAGKIDTAQRSASIKLYTKLPTPVQKAVNNPQLMDPSDQTAGLALSAGKNLLKLGSSRDERRNNGA